MVKKTKNSSTAVSQPSNDSTNNVKVGDCWYYFTQYLEAVGYVDEWGEWHKSGPSKVVIMLNSVHVTRLTPTGVVLSGGKFAAHSWVKKPAYPTVEEAKESFIRRKQKEQRIITERLRVSKEAEDLVRDYSLKDGVTPGYFDLWL